MNKLKESILNDVKKGGRDTTNTSNETTSATNNSSNETISLTITVTTRSNDTYVHDVGIIAVLPLAFVYFLHITLFNLKSSMKNKINHQNYVICFISTQ